MLNTKQAGLAKEILSVVKGEDEKKGGLSSLIRKLSADIILNEGAGSPESRVVLRAVKSLDRLEPLLSNALVQYEAAKAEKPKAKKTKKS